MTPRLLNWLSKPGRKFEMEYDHVLVCLVVKLSAKIEDGTELTVDVKLGIGDLAIMGDSLLEHATNKILDSYKLGEIV